MFLHPGHGLYPPPPAAPTDAAVELVERLVVAVVVPEEAAGLAAVVAVGDAPPPGKCRGRGLHTWGRFINLGLVRLIRFAESRLMTEMGLVYESN